MRAGESAFRAWPAGSNHTWTEQNGSGPWRKERLRPPSPVNNKVAGIESDDDDPTNTAMFLDESEEKELDRVPPGTPLCYQKLGQMTAKSITRQRDSQTPARTVGGKDSKPRTGAGGRANRYDDSESPSKKGKKGYGPLVSSAIPMMTPTPAVAAARQPRIDDTATARHPRVDDVAAEVPLSVRRIRASKRTGEVLSRIKQRQYLGDATGSSALAADPGNQGPRTGLRPTFNKNEFSPFLFSKRTQIRGDSKEQPPRVDTTQREAPATPEKASSGTRYDHRQPPDTPYNILRALSEKSSVEHSSQAAQGPEAHQGSKQASAAVAAVDPLLRTPEKQTALLPETPASVTDNKERLNSLRRFFKQRKSQPVPSQEAADMLPGPNKNDNDEMLLNISAYDPRHQQQQQQQHQRSDGSLQLSQMSSIRLGDGTADSLPSPSPIRPVRLFQEMQSRNVDTASPPFISFTSGLQAQDSSRLPPFSLDQAGPAPQRSDSPVSDDHPNFMDMSMRLNASINALNVGLREQLMGNAGKAGGSGAGIEQATSAIEKAGVELNQSLALLARPWAGQSSSAAAAGAGVAEQSATPSELECQVETLRKTMDETKAIVFAIQTELGKQRQGHVSENTKLDDIARLLGALDMRLHMLEDRQRLDQATGTSAAGASPQRSNAGSTKVAPSAAAQQDIISRIGQLIAYCLSRYPLMIIGALFIILLSELLVIGGVGLDVQTMLGEFKRHVGMPEPPS
ncbi:hypothetical protein GGF46_001623 [Coemansia sp. RSA 552]|nr:hypothetical protein GGF46_001623 [Coemansia sp. RSA 552]